MEKLLKIKEYTLWSLSLPTGEGFIFTQAQPSASNKFLCIDGVFRHNPSPFLHDFSTLQEVLTAFKKYLIAKIPITMVYGETYFPENL